MATSLGKILRDKRRAAGLSQRKLAELADLDFSYISKMENDRLPAPAAETILRLAKLVACQTEELLAAARKIPDKLNDALTTQPIAIRFLQEASKLKLSSEEWERMIGTLHQLRSDAVEEADS